MDKIQLQKDYQEYKTKYKDFQRDVRKFANKIAEREASSIDIVEIKQRPRSRIKSMKSILANIQHPDKYKTHKNIFDIKDIAGIRIICHCEDDVIKMTDLLQGEIKQQYTIIGIPELKGENNTGKSSPEYKATHITLAKQVDGHNLLCEIQIKTIMADARAVQDRKYIYGKIVEGEPKEITTAAAQIMAGCEQLRTLVKRKSIEEKENNMQKKGSKYPEQVVQVKNKEKILPQLHKNTVMEDPAKLISWFQSHKEKASEGLKKLGIQTFMEIEVHILHSELDVDLVELKDSARNSIIRTFGRPIGVYLDNKEEFYPKPNVDGIRAEISIKNKFDKDESSYDYWAINKNGAFYLKKSLFEDNRNPNQIFFNTRIVRITEVFMYIRNLYSAFGLEKDIKFSITIKHGGLRGRILGSSSPNRSLFGDRKIEIEDSSTTIETTINEIETNIVTLVEKFTKPLFELFEFFRLDRNVLEDIVINYVNGKVV